MAKSNPVFFAYGRVSTDKQDLSPDAQERAAVEYYAHRWPDETKRPTWGGWYFDNAISATRYSLHEREAGLTMLGRLRAGDHLYCAAVDRLCRNFNEFLGLWSLWKTQGIFVHISKPIPMDTSNADHSILHDMIVVNMAAFAEVERRMSSDRLKAARQEKIKRNQWWGNWPIGWRPKNVPGGIKIVRCQDTEDLARHCADLFDEGRTLMEIREQLRRENRTLPKWQRKGKTCGPATQQGAWYRAGFKKDVPGIDAIRLLVDIGFKLRESSDTIHVYGADLANNTFAPAGNRSMDRRDRAIKNLAARRAKPCAEPGVPPDPRQPPTHPPLA